MSASLFVKRVEVPYMVEGFLDVDKFIKLCQQCPRYGTRWSCPPYDKDLTPFLMSFKQAHIIGVKIEVPAPLREQSFSYDEISEHCKELMLPVRRVLDKHLYEFERAHPATRAFYAGPCHFCEECTRVQGKPCRLPEKVRYSLESVGFDVGKCTTEIIGLELLWSKDGKMPEYLSLISAIFSQESFEDAAFLHLLDA